MIFSDFHFFSHQLFKITFSQVDETSTTEINQPGVYRTVSVELWINRWVKTTISVSVFFFFFKFPFVLNLISVSTYTSLPVNTIVQSNHINEIEGVSSTISNLDALPPVIISIAKQNVCFWHD